MKIVNGKKIAQRIRGEVAQRTGELKISPTLRVISVGGNKVLEIFLSEKEKACKEVGMSFSHHRFSETTKAEEVIDLIRHLNSDPGVTGILIQLPLPPYLNSSTKLLNQINPNKDVDCLTSVNFGKFVSGTPLFVPPTAQAINEVLKAEKMKVKGENIVVVGAGRIAGLPISISLLQQGATVDICHEFTKHLKEHTKKANILISATGQPKLIKGPMVKKGAVVIDVGTSWVNGKMVGDVDIKTLEGIASRVTPVPGGIGPIMVACLLRNVLKATKLQITA